MDRELQSLLRHYHSGDLDTTCQIVRKWVRMGKTNIPKLTQDSGLVPADVWDCLADHPVGYTRHRVDEISHRLHELGVEFNGPHYSLNDMSFLYPKFLPEERGYDPLRQAAPITCSYYFVARWADAEIPDIGIWRQNKSSVVYEDEPRIYWKTIPTIFVGNVPIDRGDNQDYSAATPTNRVDMSDLRRVSRGVDLLINDIVPRVHADDEDRHDLSNHFRIWHPREHGWEAVNYGNVYAPDDFPC